MKVKVIGAGLAGCEAAYALATRGVEVDLYEMKPHRRSPAHHNDNFAELVCSNSLKAARLDSAAGLLKEEMRRLGSVCMNAGKVLAEGQTHDVLRNTAVIEAYLGETAEDTEHG